MITQDQAWGIHGLTARIIEAILARGGTPEAVVARMEPNTAVIMDGLIILALCEGNTPEQIEAWFLRYVAPEPATNTEAIE